MAGTLVRVDLPVGKSVLYYGAMTNGTFADLVRDGLASRGWTQARLARETGISEANISKLLKGRRVGRGDTVAIIERTLGLDPAAVSAAMAGRPVPDRQRDETPLELTERLLSALRSASVPTAPPVDEDGIVASIRAYFAEHPDAASPEDMERVVATVAAWKRRRLAERGE